MKSIITWAYSTLLNPVPVLDLSSIPAKPRGKLRLSPEQLLAFIHAPALAEWTLRMTWRLLKPRLPRGPGGKPLTYPDHSTLLMAVVQTTWRKSYEQMVDWVATNEALALALGFTQRTSEGGLQSISKGKYWERRQALGILPFLFFFLALVAQLHDFIATLPSGYDTLIGENGLLLSGGERQRLAIARVILKNAPILILDEAMANLDGLTVQKLMQSVESFMVGRTVLIISHRRIGMPGVDQIIALENGQVVNSNY